MKDFNHLNLMVIIINNNIPSRKQSTYVCDEWPERKNSSLIYIIFFERELRIQFKCVLNDTKVDVQSVSGVQLFLATDLKIIFCSKETPFY